MAANLKQIWEGKGNLNKLQNYKSYTFYSGKISEDYKILAFLGNSFSVAHVAFVAEFGGLLFA